MATWTTGAISFKPEHLNEGGDYLYKDELLVYQRLPGNHYTVGPGYLPILSFDQHGNLIVAERNGRVYRSTNGGRTWEQIAVVTWKGIGLVDDGNTSAAGSAQLLGWYLSQHRRR